MDKQLPKRPAFDVPALNNPAAEADAALIAGVWKAHGFERAVVSLFMVNWLNDAVAWEQGAIGSRAKFLASL